MMVKRLVRATWVNAAAAGAVAVFGLAANAVHADEHNSTVDQSQANRLSTFHDYGLNAFGATTGAVANTPGSPGHGMWTSFMGTQPAADVTPPDRGWYILGSPFVGYDTNPEARHEDRSSFFGGADLNAGYGIELEPNDPNLGGPAKFNMNYDLAGAIYEGHVKQADAVQQTLSADGSYGVINKAMILSLRAQDQYTFMQGHSFLNTVDLVPSAEVFWFPQWSTEFIYDYTLLDYFYPVTPSLDMDSDRHTLTANLHFYPLPPNPNAQVPESKDRLTDLLRQMLHRATIGLAHVWNGSEGFSNEYEANRLILGLQGLRFGNTPDLAFDLEYAHDWVNYLKGTTESLIPPPLGGSAKGFRRHDHIDFFTIRGNARLLDLPRNRGTLAGYLQYDLIFDQSNIFQRDYNEHIVSAGITYRY